jgi:hypothetical protein
LKVGRVIAFVCLIDDMKTAPCSGAASKTFKDVAILKTNFAVDYPPLQKHSQTLSENACNGASFLLLTTCTLYSDATSAPHKSD